jgi:hypothetical protein
MSKAFWWTILICMVLAIVSKYTIFKGGDYEHSAGYRQVREAMLNANLQRLRNAITSFHTDTGVYPDSLEDLTASATDGTTAGTTTVPAKSYKGPYLEEKDGIGGTQVPRNWFTPKDDPVISHHWTYTPATGKIHSAVDGKTLDGVAYTAL